MADARAQQPLDITITPLRRPALVERVGSSVTVVGAEEIEREQQRTLPDALRDAPGLNLVQAGGLGGTASVFIRGANANHTKVLIDGVDAGDPSADGAFDFGQISTFGVERIEVLRGPQSGLYGSDAIGGVVNVITARGRGPTRIDGQVEGGSFETFNQAAGLSGATGRAHYAFSVSHLHSDDTPVTPLRLLSPGRGRTGDSYDNLTFSTRLGADLTESFGVDFTVRRVEASSRFTGDDFSTFPSVPAATRSRAENEQLFARGEARLALLDGRFEQRVGLGAADFERRFTEPDGTPSGFGGSRVKADWRGDLALGVDHDVLVGVEREEERLSDSPLAAENGNTAAYGQLHATFGEKLFAAVSARVDDNDAFDRAVTYRFAPSLRVPEWGARFKASYGTGFKAPSLTQLFVSFPAFNFFANPDLRPEESRGWDLGYEQALPGRRLRFGATYFRNDIEDLITANAASTSLENRPSATIYGVESFVAFAPSPAVALRADHTYIVAEDEETGGELPRRPKHKASVSAEWRVGERTTLAAGALHVSSRVDGNRDFSIQRLEAKPYTIANLTAAYDVDERLTAFARVENLFDRRYEDPSGFERPGLGLFVGLRLKLDAETLVSGRMGRE